MATISDKLGRLLARYLNKPLKSYQPSSMTPPGVLEKQLKPGDVLLIEGNKRVSAAIKYLTQSTWSHAAICVGALDGEDIDVSMLVEADLQNGVIAVPVSKFECFHTRICRPVGLGADDIGQVVDFVVERIGLQYDLKNIIDLMRYLFPTPPVPVRWRRKMLALGSGDPTRAICSTLIAQAFHSINYPILPTVEEIPAVAATGTNVPTEILHIRHHSLFTPRDFDVSPYFRIIKPTLSSDFDHRQLNWESEH